MTSAAQPGPPSLAVVRDPHWAATRARLAARQRPVIRLVLCDDEAAKDRHIAAQYAHRIAKTAVEADPGNEDLEKALTAAATELQAAQEAFDEATIVLRFQALRRLDYEALRNSHPPTPEQAEDGMQFNAETFGPALVARSSMDGMTVKEATQYLAEWSTGEAAQLFDAAWRVQGETRQSLKNG